MDRHKEASLALAASFRGFYDVMEDSDFKLISNEGEEFPVHSLVLKCRSEFFKVMMGSNLRESTEKCVKLKMKTKATEQFVKYLYGFELDDNLDLDIVRELMEYGKMYLFDSLQKAAGKKLKRLFTKDNVFDLLNLFDEKNVEIGMNLCFDFVSLNFEQTFLMENGLFETYPQICQKILEHEHDKKMANRNPMRGDGDSMRMACYDTFLGERFDGCLLSPIKKSYVVDIKSKPGIYITGIGLPVLPHSNLNVKIFASKHHSFNWDNPKLIHEGRLIPSGHKDTDIEPINFQTPIKLNYTSDFDCTQITIQIWGQGALRFGCRKRGEPFQENKWSLISTDYSRKNGLAVNLEVSIRTEDKGILAELYIKPSD